MRPATSQCGSRLPLLRRAGGIRVVDLRDVPREREGNLRDAGGGGFAGAGLGAGEPTYASAALREPVAALLRAIAVTLRAPTLVSVNWILAFPARRVMGDVEPRAALVLCGGTLRGSRSSRRT